MPACPNCGRPTLRTRDWACQWCGYPLLSKAYKKIDKTYKELQEERFPVSMESPPQPASQPEAVAPPPSEPEVPSPPEPESNLPPEPTPAPETTPQPESKTESVLVTPPPVVTPTPQIEPGPSVTEPPPEPTPKPEATLTPPPPPEPEMQATPKSESEPSPESEPTPVALPDLDAVNDGATLTVDELDALYKENRLSAHARLTDKTIQIKGFVEKVFIRDHIDVRYIVLTGTRKKVVWPVRCTFSKENISTMSRLAAGQEVTLLGKYDSYGKNIIFKDCVLTG